MGQFCTKPGLIFGLQNAEFDQFQQALARALEAVAPATMLHSGICEAYHDGSRRAAAASGVSLLARSAAAALSARTHGEAMILRTDLETFRKNPELAEEVFGPFAILISTGTLAESEEVARSLEGQLTATVHGTVEDLSQAGGLLRLLE